MTENCPENFLNAVEKLIATRQFKTTLDLMRTWLATSVSGEPEALLAQCSDTLKPKVILLLRDLLSRYPHTIVGAPSLIYLDNDLTDKEGKPASVRLPFPDPTLESPAPNLTFLGWIGVDTQLPLPIPFRPERHAIYVPSKKVAAAIALFRSTPDLFDGEDDVRLSDEWFAALFKNISGSCYMSSRIIAPYPDAIELGREMLCAALGTKQPEVNHFITEAGVQFAQSSGQLFSKCRQM